MNLGNFLAQLQRRNDYKVAAAYAVVGWLLLPIATPSFTKIVASLAPRGMP